MPAIHPNIRFNSDRERRSYESGQAIVAKKLAAAHRPTAAEISAASIANGHRMIRHKLAADRTAKTMAQPRVIKIITDAADRAVAAFSKPKAAQAPARKPSPVASRRNYSTGFEVQPLKRHHFACPGGIFGT